MKMKSIAFLVLAVLFVACPVIAGPYIWSETATIQNAATGTTAEVASSSFVFQHPVKFIGCDVSTSPTGTVKFRLEGNEGFLASFPTHSTSMAIISNSTCTIAGCYYTAVDKPVRVIRSVVSTATDTTKVVTVTCTGMQ